MPARKKKRPAARKPAKKKTARKAKRKVVAKKRAGKKVARKVSAKRRAKAVAAVKRAVQPRPLGRVVHFYDRISVAIIELAAPLKVGDAITFKRGDHEHTQTVGSMQVRHQPIAKAKKGDVVGVQVSKEVADGSIVTPA